MRRRVRHGRLTVDDWDSFTTPSSMSVMFVSFVSTSIRYDAILKTFLSLGYKIGRLSRCIKMEREKILFSDKHGLRCLLKNSVYPDASFYWYKMMSYFKMARVGVL